MIICCYSDINSKWNEQELVEKLALLPEKLQQQALRKSRWIDKQLSITGKLLLLRLYKEFDQQLTLSDLKYNAYHRPFFDDGPDFNIAHSGNMAVCCGTDTGHVGIDIEQVKEIDLADYSDYFTPNEWDKINGYHDKYDGFYDFWTRKEAVLKAIGTGFHTPLSTVDVSEDTMSFDEVSYHIQTLNIRRDYKCHISTTIVPENIRLIQVNL